VSSGHQTDGSRVTGEWSAGEGINDEHWECIMVCHSNAPTTITNNISIQQQAAFDFAVARLAIVSCLQD